MYLSRLTVLACLLRFAPVEAQSAGRIVGVVADSISGSPLRGAEVVVSGTSRTARTDSLGRFEIDSLVPGSYQVGIFHPLLESLGITLATQSFALGRDSAAVVNLAIPSIPSLVRRYCRDQQTGPGVAALVGRVLDPDTDIPIPGALVSLEWTEVFVSKETGVVHNRHLLHTQTANNGFFQFCGLPSDLYGTLQAAKDAVETPEVPVSVNGALLDFENMSIPAGDAPAKGTVSGHVVSSAGNPVGAARVEIPVAGVAATSREDGSFVLTGVKTGTAVLVARRLGYSTAAEPINVSSREPLDVVVTLPDRINILDPVLVTARRRDALDKNGFAARKQRGSGYFFTREDLDRRQPNNVTDMLKNLPLLTVTSRPGGSIVTGRGGTISLYGPRAGTCVNVVIDGVYWRDMGPGDLDLFVNPDDVIGLEVYRPEDVPTKFRQAGVGCVAVVVWTQFRGKPSK